MHSTIVSPTQPGRILIVDQDPDARQQLRGYLQPQYTVRLVSSASEAVRAQMEFRPDVVLLDQTLESSSGQVCQRIKQSRGDTVQVVIIAARSSHADENATLTSGADDYMVKPINRFELDARIRLHLRLRNALSRLEAQRDPHRKTASEPNSEDSRIQDTQDVAVFALAKVAESRDTDTGDHLIRMRSYSQILAEYLHRHGPYRHEIDEQFLHDLYRASPLHDIGKVGISDAILLKPDRLSPEEFEKMKQHTIIGANILEQAMFRSASGSFLAMAASVARFHHERFDGSGYPAGLIGREIPLPARIVALADVFDALTSERPYKSPYNAERAKELIVPETGKHFDPVIVEAFLACYDDFLKVRQDQAAQPLNTNGALAFV